MTFEIKLLKRTRSLRICKVTGDLEIPADIQLFCENNEVNRLFLINCTFKELIVPQGFRFIDIQNCNNLQTVRFADPNQPVTLKLSKCPSVYDIRMPPDSAVEFLRSNPLCVIQGYHTKITRGFILREMFHVVSLLKLQQWFRRMNGYRRLKQSYRDLIQWFYAPDGPGGRRVKRDLESFCDSL